MDNQEENMDVPRPIQIIKINDDHSYTLDETSLKRVLLSKEIKHRSVVVVSVAGNFRKGKSFLLGFFLRYLNAQYRKMDVTEWLGDEDQPMEGFAWSGGSERITNGIWIWSDIFTYDKENGEKIAILLLDTQGTFDTQSTVRDSATIFAMSTLLSSVQCYNLKNNIQEDDLQHLHLFTEYGRLVTKDSGDTPFQRLQFIVRDWYYPHEHAFGQNGGKCLLEKRLSVSPIQDKELQILRKQIRPCFTEIQCFLMPHPGLVVTEPEFDGCIRRINVQFIEQVKLLVPMLLAPENLIVKKIHKQIVTAENLFDYIKSYLNIFAGDEMPALKSILTATAETFYMATAIPKARKQYIDNMTSMCSGLPFFTDYALEELHRITKEKVLYKFKNTRKMGGDELLNSYVNVLKTEMDEQFYIFRAKNNEKFRATLIIVGTIISLAPTLMLISALRYACVNQNRIKKH